MQPGGSAGGWAALIGASGCGKSTLLRILSDIVHPTSGAVSLVGDTPAQTRAARSFALVSQQSVLLANFFDGLDIGQQNYRAMQMATYMRSPPHVGEGHSVDQPGHLQGDD